MASTLLRVRAPHWFIQGQAKGGYRQKCVRDYMLHSQHLFEGHVLLDRRVAHVKYRVPSALRTLHHRFKPLSRKTDRHIKQTKNNSSGACFFLEYKLTCAVSTQHFTPRSDRGIETGNSRGREWEGKLGEVRQASCLCMYVCVSIPSIPGTCLHLSVQAGAPVGVVSTEGRSPGVAF